MLRRFLVLTASAALFVPMLAADDPNAAQKVKALVTKLGAEKEADRKAAEEELIKFGVAALPHLPASEDKNLTAEQKERLSRVLPKIWQARVEQDVAGSFVEIPKGAMPLADALREIERQTGNVVRDQREEFNEEATNPTIQFDGKKRKFWEAMDLLCKDAGITLEHFAGESAISIRAQGMGANPSTVTIGALRFTPQTITLTRNLGMGPAKCTVNILSVFEPRLKPMLVEVDVDSFKILDDQNRALKFAAERQQSMCTFQVQEGVRDRARSGSPRPLGEDDQVDHRRSRAPAAGRHRAVHVRQVDRQRDAGASHAKHEGESRQVQGRRGRALVVSTECGDARRETRGRKFPHRQPRSGDLSRQRRRQSSRSERGQRGR
jgi:hypothetical protein